MKQLVIIPGGFHPFHAGHAALYQSAQAAFPAADVYVAATNDTSTRPFPFAIKEKLAKLAGVEAGHFIQVKSPFRAEEIVNQFDPNDTQLIFVRSEKDANKPPQGGGTKKDGSPSYLQPLGDDTQPLSQHAYMAYLPTVEFGPGMTSATEIRTAWPTLNEKRKTALVMSLYPKTQTNPKLAANVVKMLDTAMGVVDESALGNLPRPNKRNQFKSLHRLRKQRGLDKQGVAEGQDDKAEAYRAHLIKTLPQIMKLFANIGKGWIPSKEQMLSAVDTAYTVMKHTGDVKQAGKVLMDELNTLYRMSQGKQGVAEASNTMQRYGQTILKRARAARAAEQAARAAELEPKKEEPPAPSVTSSISTRDLMQQLKKPKKKGVAAAPDYMEENIKRE